MLKNKRLYLIVCTLSLVLYGALSQLPFSPSNNETEVIQINKRELQVPLKYFDIPIDHNASVAGFLLRVTWPNASSVQINQFRNEKYLPKNIGWILIEDANKRPTLSEQDKISTQFSDIRNMGSAGKLEHYRRFLEVNSRRVHAEDRFLQIENGEVVRLINCVPVKARPVPICSHSFIHEGLIYKLTYNRELFLRNWEKLETNAVGLIRSFDMTHPNL